MQIHTITKTYKTKAKKRVGRGGKRGTYSGKGMKGQKSRAGKNIRPAERDYIIRLPKKRGVKFKSIKIKPEIINISQLDKNFKNNDTISPRALLDKGLVKRQGRKNPEVKILAMGDTKKKFIIKNCQFSKEAGNKLGISTN